MSEENLRERMEKACDNLEKSQAEAVEQMDYYAEQKLREAMKKFNGFITEINAKRDKIISDLRELRDKRKELEEDAEAIFRTDYTEFKDIGGEYTKANYELELAERKALKEEITEEETHELNELRSKVNYLRLCRYNNKNIWLSKEGNPKYGEMMETEAKIMDKLDELFEVEDELLGVEND